MGGLGVVYSASIVFALFCTRSPLRKRIAAVIGAALSWGFLVISLAPVKHAAEQSTWLRVPDVATVVHFYNNHPLLFTRHRYASVTPNIVLLLLDAYAIVWFIRSRGWKTQSNSFALVFYIAVILTLEPIGFGILSNLYQPVFLGRYLLPYSLGVITLAAAGAWQLSHPFIHRHPRTFATLVVVPLMTIVCISFAGQYLDPVSNLDPVLQAAQSMPTVVGNDAIVRDAHYYTPEKAKNIFFVMDGPTPPPYGTLHVVTLQGYDPALVFHQPFLSTHHDFLYIPGGWQPRFVADLEKDPHWKSEQIGSVTIQQEVFPVLRFTYLDGTEGK